jgi:hypothetical protein
MKKDYFKNCLCLLFVIFAQLPEQAIACMGEPALAELQDGIRITARAQNGLHLKGKHALPEVISIESMEGTKIALKNLGQAEGMKNTNSLVERVSGKSPEYESYPIEKTLELKPESIPETDLRYKLKLKDGTLLVNIELLLRGGMVKGCGGAKAQIETL